MTPVCVYSNATGIGNKVKISFVPEYKAGSFRFIPSAGGLCFVFKVFDSLPRLRDFFSSERLRNLNCKGE